MDDKAKKIYAILPVYAKAKFFIYKPDNWKDLSTLAREKYFIENCDTDAYLCRDCEDEIETDFEIDEDNLERVELFN